MLLHEWGEPKLTSAVKELGKRNHETGAVEDFQKLQKMELHDVPAISTYIHTTELKLSISHCAATQILIERMDHISSKLQKHSAQRSRVNLLSKIEDLRNWFVSYTIKVCKRGYVCSCMYKRLNILYGWRRDNENVKRAEEKRDPVPHL